jgi:long-chain fatty acid transport protein
MALVFETCSDFKEFAETDDPSKTASAHRREMKDLSNEELLDEHSAVSRMQFASVHERVATGGDSGLKKPMIERKIFTMLALSFSPRSRGLRAVRLTLLVLAVQMGVSEARAGGLFLSEFATTDMGAAGSGLLAGNSKSSATLGNPAAMTLLDSHNLHLGIAPGASFVEFDPDNDPRNGGGDGGNQGGFVPLLSAGYVHKLTDRIRLGLGSFSMAGAVLDPNDDWVGRSEATDISLMTLTFKPSVGIRVTDWLSVGAGAIVTYATLDWELRTPLGPGPNPAETRVKLDDLNDWGAGAVVGVLAEPHEDVRVGLIYQSKTNLTLRGNTSTSGPLVDNLDTKLDLDLPQAVRGDVRWQALERVAFSFGGAWEDWGSLQTTRIRLGGFDNRVRLGFRDTYKLRGGIHYQLNEKTMLQTGLSYDSSALRTRDRIAALPIHEQWRWGIGGSYDWSAGTRIGWAFQWTHLGQGKLDTSNVKGEYDRNDIFFFVLTLNLSKLPWDGMGTF